jgi:hypothetical protein
MKTLTKVVLFLGIIFLGSIILSGAVSATSSSISADGKNISVKYNYITSTLKDQVSITKKTGSYGYGYYGTVHTSGKDIKGNNINRTTVYFNKYHNYFTFNDFKTGTLKESNADGSWTNSNIKVTSTYLMTSTSTGRTFNGLTFSGTENYTLYYASNGQKLIKNSVMTTKFYKNGVYYATVTSKEIPTYKYIGNSYLTIKETATINTLYANNNTRKSIISQLCTRNSAGTLIGMKTSGTSSGTEKVNGKTVTYTGKITIPTKYDPKDTWDEKYTTGNYYETRTSTSTNLVRILPLEAV